MLRTIAGYHQDNEGDWVAEISCGHTQHVRHRPPFQSRGWVLEEKGRADRIGTEIDRTLCERTELPEGRWDAQVAEVEPLPPLVELVADQAGDPACWTGLLCPGCGVVMGDGDHDRNCPVGPRL